MCMVDIGESSEFTRVKWRVARCEHRCGDCHHDIAKGERYKYASGKYDDGFWDAKQCEKCDIGAAWLLKYCHGFLYAAVLDDLQEHLDDAWHDLTELQQWELIDTYQRMGRQADLDEHIEEWELVWD